MTTPSRREEGLDVLVQGEGVRRDVPVEIGQESVRLGSLRLPYPEIFWTSRRAGLLMLFARERTVAVKGSGSALQALTGAVEGRVGGTAGRGRLPPDLAEEVILCTAGAAAVGSVAGHAVSGLRVMVVTRRGLHLLTGREDLRLGWPAEEARVTAREEEGHKGSVVVLRKGESELRILYLFPEEREVLVRAARGEAPEERLTDGPTSVELARPRSEEGETDDGGDGDRAGGTAGRPEGEEAGGEDPDGDAGTEADAGTGAESLELFDRREVAGPVAPELPEFRVSVETLQRGAERAAAGLSGERVRSAGLSPHFLETHLLELGEIALGPLLLRKSAASTARSLDRAAEAMDPSELREDTRAAVENAADRMLEVYDRELGRLIGEKRAPSRVREEHGLSVEEREELRLRLQAPFEKLQPRLRELADRRGTLRRRLQELEGGPPGAEEGEARAAAREWRETLEAVDRAFESAWEDFLEEVSATWGDRMLPSLGEVGGMRRRRFPEWVTLALLGVVTLILAAAAVILLVW
jgi:hypothetical protein